MRGKDRREGIWKKNREGGKRVGKGRRGGLRRVEEEERA